MLADIATWLRESSRWIRSDGPGVLRLDFARVAWNLAILLVAGIVLILKCKRKPSIGQDVHLKYCSAKEAPTLLRESSGFVDTVKSALARVNPLGFVEECNTQPLLGSFASFRSESRKISRAANCSVKEQTGALNRTITSTTHTSLVAQVSVDWRNASRPPQPPKVLMVLDEPSLVMAWVSWLQEYEVTTANNLVLAVTTVIMDPATLPDIVLLGDSVDSDCGYSACSTIRQTYNSAELPVIIVTSRDKTCMDSRWLDVDANDLLLLPMTGRELQVRVQNQLKLKRLGKLETEAARNRSLLNGMLPDFVIGALHESMAQRSSRTWQIIHQKHDQVTILFSDVVNFTVISSTWPTSSVVAMLNELFTAFDVVCDKNNVYKVETIGDAYMIVAGQDGAQDHVQRMLACAADMLEAVEELKDFQRRVLDIPPEDYVQIRIGIHTGPAYSGVVGMKCPRYCFFGDTVNTASRMESHGFASCLHISDATYKAVTALPRRAMPFEFCDCGPREIKGKGVMNTYLAQIGSYGKALQKLKHNIVDEH